MNITNENIKLYMSLFRGRDDIYARRWEKYDKSGYMPAYNLDWNEYNIHKAKGGTFQNFKNKTHKPYNKSAVIEHLNGNSTFGIYPLLADNTSYFIAADFDKKSWLNESLRFISVCQEFKLKAYLERSRSGNGGHVWIFFEERIPAKQSRRIIFELLRKAKVLSEFEKEASFDRLFPNQDFHKGKGYGNLIALPLNGKSLQNNNSAFLSLETKEPYQNQWLFLNEIKKIPNSIIDKLNILLSDKDAGAKTELKPYSSKELEITFDRQLYLKRIQLVKPLIEFIRDNLNFINSEWIVKKKLGKSIYNVEMFFKLIEEKENEIIIPRGFISKLVEFCKTEDIKFQISDKRKKHKSIEFKSSIELYKFQAQALEITEKKDFGVIVAPPSSGKTILGLELIVRKQQPALIIVHRKQLFDQWIDRIQSFTGIAKAHIGQIGGGKKKIGKQITVAMMQSLARHKNIEDYANKFGMIIIDECHHIPAKTFRETIIHFNSYYLYGLTATPKRKNNDEKLIYVYIGEILHEISQKEFAEFGQSKFEINIKETNLFVPFDYKTDKYETVSQILVFDTSRNQLIISDIIAEVPKRKTILVLTERKSHINVLNLYLKDKFETITLSGDDSETKRKSKLKQIKDGHFKIIISTGQFFGEGIDIDNIDCLFLVYPFAFEGKLIQYIGRIQRSKTKPVIYDYRDSKIDYFEKMFKKRNRYYKKLIKQQLVDNK